jgi:hypothetical protein
MARFRGERKKVVFAKRGLILCEGETEENYFKGLITQEKHRRKFQSINVDIYKPKDHSPVGLVNHAKEKIRDAKREKNPFDFVWVLFDKDGHAKIPDAFEIARSTNPKIEIAFAIPCFEYFVLLHFEKTTKPFVKCDDVISYIKSKSLPDYEKATNIFNVLLPYMTTGIENSKWLIDQNRIDTDSGKKVYELSAHSNIHELVEYLFSLL